MDNLDAIGERIQEFLESKNSARDRALKLSRTVIRQCSLAIRAAHREEDDLVEQHLREAREQLDSLAGELEPYPDLYHAGYTQSALKEFAEASIVYALVRGKALPGPEDLGVEYAAYLGGLSETTGELRRRVLDLLRHDRLDEAERLLEWMDEIFGLLVTMDFPDAITDGLRRKTDMVRGVTERTRGDLTTTRQQHELQAALEDVARRLDLTDA
jgi:translin